MTPRRTSLFIALALVLTAPSGAITPNGKLQVVHLDVGEGDGAVLITPLGQVAMIDDGGATFPSFPCSKVLAQLDTLGITHIDYHFASHYHSDHIGCFSSVDNVVHFDQGWDRGGSYGSTVYSNYVSALGARRRTLTKGRVFTLDSLSAHPVTITCVDFNGAGNDDYENSKSVVLRVDYGYFSESFGGDLQGYSGSGRRDSETAFSPEVDTVMVYKVHHHSSKYSTNDTWLNKTAPMVGIISLGDNNPYSYPTSDALGRLHDHHVHTYWTERGSTSGASPDSNWDKVAHGRITINAVWEGQGKTVISGGYGTNAFSDTLINPGPPPVGACCNPTTGACALSSQASCASPNVWHAEETSCSPNPCPQPQSACCDPVTGACTLTSEADCQAPSVWHPEWTSCSPNPCPQPQSACCDPVTGACVLTSEVGCQAPGIWYAEETSCSPNPCPQPQGACCDPATASCTVISQLDCITPSIWHGEWTTCVPDLCPTSGIPAIAVGVGEGFFGAVPNPFATSTALWYRLSKTGYVLLEIFDAGGHKVQSLAVGEMGPGAHSIDWDGRGLGGGPVTSGVFFARLSAAGHRWTQTLIRLK